MNWSKGDISHILTRNVIIDECLNQFEKCVDTWDDNLLLHDEFPTGFVEIFRENIQHLKDNFEEVIRGTK